MNGVIAQALPHAHFTALDWTVIAVYLAGTTWLGARLAGRPSTIRDFFLGGRRLPWWAVSGSILATEISAVTFVSVPARAYAPGGDFTYLQLALGSIAARIIIGYWFVPAYYEREVYSPYEYMGRRLGPGVNTAATGLFMLGAVLSQGVRLFLTALVLQVASGIELWRSIWLIGAFSVAWTLLGGITTVIWTDVIQFIVLVGGAVMALVWVVTSVPGGMPEVLRLAEEEQKLRVFDLSFDPGLEYTLWTGLFGMVFLNLAALGTDQVMAQRIFCCRGSREARRAVIWSAVGIAVPVLMLFVGIGLYAYFVHFPMSADEHAFVTERRDRVFPLFLVRVLPAGITGLVIAGIFAAAISTLDSTLAALAQTSVSTIVGGWRERTGRGPLSDAASLRCSRALVVFWGVVLSAAATGLTGVRGHANVIDMALAVPSFTYGALLGMLLLALGRGRRSDAGLVVGVPASVGVVIALHWLTSASGAAPPMLRLAYPWFYPIGTAVTYLAGRLLSPVSGGDGGPSRARR